MNNEILKLKLDTSFYTSPPFWASWSEQLKMFIVLLLMWSFLPKVSIKIRIFKTTGEENKQAMWRRMLLCFDARTSKQQESDREKAAKKVWTQREVNSESRRFGRERAAPETFQEHIQVIYSGIGFTDSKGHYW